jgi:flavin-dependent dehydrogenase
LEITGRVVIAADGSNSKMASLLNPRQKNTIGRAIAIRAYIDDFAAKPNTVEAFFRKEFWPGYAWIFPVSDTKVNIGLGYRLDDRRGQNINLKQVFQEFLKSGLIAPRMGSASQVLDVRAKLLNLGFDRHYPRAFNGALLVGDAANLVNPLTGGGICNAMISGKLAAETVIKAFAANDVSRQTLNEYENRLATLVRKELQYSEYLARFFYAAPPLVIRLLSLSIKRGPLPLMLQKMFADVRIS